MSNGLRSAVIKLAHAQPTLRKPLLNILREATVDLLNEFTIWTATPDQLAKLTERRKRAEPRMMVQAEDLSAAVQAAVRAFFKDDRITTNLRVSPDHTGKSTSVENNGRIYMIFYLDMVDLPRDLHIREARKIYDKAVKMVSWKDSVEVVGHSLLWSESSKSMKDDRATIKIREKTLGKF